MGHELDRRQVLHAGVVTAAAVGATAMGVLRLPGAASPAAQVRAAGTDAGGYEVIANAFGFAVDIPGLPTASRNIREIAIDELTIDSRELTTGLDDEYRRYGPGAAHWGSARLVSAIPIGASEELGAWWEAAAKGKNVRKNITVTLFKSDKSPGRSYTLFDCFPTGYSAGTFDTSSTVQTERVSCKIGRIEFKT